MSNHFLLLFLIAPFVLSSQTPGDLDPTFNNNNTYTIPQHSAAINCVQVQPNGKIALGGSNGGNYLAGRLNIDGVGDTSFDGGDSPAERDGFWFFNNWQNDILPKTIADVRVLPDSRLMTIGSYTNSGVFYSSIERLVPGTPRKDVYLTSHSLSLVLSAEVKVASLALMSNTQMQLSASIRYTGLSWDICLYRLMYNGSFDITYNGGYSTFDLGGDEWVRGMILDESSQRTWVAGYTAVPHTASKGFLVRFSGYSIDSTWASNGVLFFGRNGNDTITSVARSRAGCFLVSGSSEQDTLSRDEASVWKFNANGTPDLLFGNNGLVVLSRPAGERSRFEKVLVQPDGKVIGVGWRQNAVDAQLMVSRFDSTGVPDQTFGIAGTVTYDILSGSSHGLNADFQVVNNQLYLIVVGDAQGSSQGSGFIVRLYLGYGVCAIAPVYIVLSGNTDLCTYGCDTLHVAATNAISYEWQGGFTGNALPVCSLSNDVTYHVTATSIYGCTATDSLLVHVHPVLPVITVSSPVCIRGPLQITGHGGVSYEWRTPTGTMIIGDTLYYPTSSTVQTGIYQVTATNAEGCTASTGKYVNVNDPPALQLDTNLSALSIENGHAAVLATNTNAGSYVYWNAQDTNNASATSSGLDSNRVVTIPVGLSTPNAPGTVDLKLWSSSGGCYTDTLSLQLSVWPANSTTSGLYIPEIFTPNGDGANDEWVVSTHSGSLPSDLDVHIFNKQGVPVFVRSHWDGRWDGQNLSEGTYWYWIGDSDTPVIAKGNLLLLRK